MSSPSVPRSRPLLALLAIVGLLAGAVVVSSSPVAATVTTSSAVEMPGFASIADGTQEGRMTNIDCPAPGECVAVGVFGSSNYPYGWGATMTGGVWGPAAEITSIAAIDPFHSVGFFDISCAAVGECLAGGVVRHDGTMAGYDAFVVAMVGGVWQTAAFVGGVALGVASWVFDIDCPAVGECVVAGRADNNFVADMVGGVLGDAVRIPGLDPSLGYAEPKVSCASVDFCVYIGTYHLVTGQQLAGSIRDAGTWQPAMLIADPNGVNAGDSMYATSLVCPAVDSCAVSGIANDNVIDVPIVVDMTAGAFSDLTRLPIDSTLSTSPFLEASQMACPAVGECVIGGIYYDASWHPSLFVSIQTGGVWGPAIAMPGLVSVVTPGVEPTVRAISCSAVGACVFLGQQAPGSPDSTALMLILSGGQLGTAQAIPGLDLLQTGTQAMGTAISCTSDGSCVGGGGLRTVNHFLYDMAFTFSVTGLEAAPPPTTTTTSTTTSTTTTSTSSTTTSTTSTTIVDPVATTAADDPVAPEFTG